MGDGIAEAIDWYLANDKSPRIEKKAKPASFGGFPLKIVPPSQAPRAD